MAYLPLEIRKTFKTKVIFFLSCLHILPYTDSPFFMTSEIGFRMAKFKAR